MAAGEWLVGDCTVSDCMVERERCSYVVYVHVTRLKVAFMTINLQYHMTCRTYVYVCVHISLFQVVVGHAEVAAGLS